MIHGYGSTGTGGVLRARLRGFCDTHADRVGYARGEDAEGNPGVTVVTVRAALPDALAALVRQGRIEKSGGRRRGYRAR